MIKFTIFVAAVVLYVLVQFVLMTYSIWSSTLLAAHSPGISQIIQMPRDCAVTFISGQDVGSLIKATVAETSALFAGQLRAK